MPIVKQMSKFCSFPLQLDVELILPTITITVLRIIAGCSALQIDAELRLENQRTTHPPHKIFEGYLMLSSN